MEYLKGILVYIGLPILLFLAYIQIRKRLEFIKNPEPALRAFLPIYVHYAMVICWLVSAFSGFYSGMHFLSGIYPITFGLLFMGVAAHQMYPLRGITRYHWALFVSAMLYIVLIVLPIAILVIRLLIF